MVKWIEDMPQAARVRHRGKYDWEAVAADLRKRPGKWALVAQDVPRSHAWQIKRGLYAAFRPAEHWLVRTQGPTGSRGDLYMAYIGVPGARLSAERDAPWSKTAPLLEEEEHRVDR